MGTLTQGLFSNQKANDWFSAFTDQGRNDLISKYKIPRSIEDGTLTNGDVLKMYRAEMESKVKA